MRFFVYCIFAIILTVSAQAQSLRDSVARPQSVGLVLSGGGAKGIAHIGVIKALEENNIPIDYIAGTSMGAIVGSLYACGFTTDEMLAIIASEDFQSWSTGTIQKKLTYYFLEDAPTPAFLNIPIGRGDSTQVGSFLPTSLINPLPMNFGFMELFSAYTAQCGGDFNRLFVPFRCVASDVVRKCKKVWSEGQLGDAVRTSMTYPLVFQPIDIDGVPMYDGGIYDNFPVDVMRSQFAPQIMIGVDVSSSSSSDKSLSMLDQLELMIMQHSNSRLSANEGIKMRIHLEQFGLLDFNKASQISKIGYDQAISMMDSIKTRIVARAPKEAVELRRQVFKSQTPYLHFDSVNVSGANRGQKQYIRYLFTHNRPDTFGISRAREAYYRAITPGKFKNLVPTAVYNDSTRLFTLDLKAQMNKDLSLGLGGYLTTSTQSMLFLTGRYKTLNFSSLTASLNGWVGQSYLAAEATASIKLLRSTPSGLTVSAVASRQKYFGRDRMFFQTSEPTVVTTDEYFGRLMYGVAMGSSGKGSLTAGYGYIEGKHFGSEPDRREVSRQRLAQAVARYEYNTLDNNSMPTDGAFVQASAMGVIGQHYFTPAGQPSTLRVRDGRSWWQIEVLLRRYWSTGQHFSIGTELNLLGSSRKLLPSYEISLMDAPSYCPSPSFSNLFLSELRGNSFGAVGLIPIWKMSQMIQIRGKFDCFMPLRPILENPDGTARYGKYLSHATFFGQLEAALTFSFGNVSAYAHYCTADHGNWNFGLSFGLFIQAPRFLR